MSTQSLDAYRRTVDDIDDITLIPNPTNNLVADVLKQRYNRQLFYTYVGSSVVALNPYQKTDLYEDIVQRYYHAHAPNALAPHLYSIAEDALRTISETGKPQAIIVTGESGAGKTESAKKVMEYITAMSSSAGVVTEEIKQIILKSNPLFEAFGNAVTVMNDNSSRFGKYTDLFFDKRGTIIGAQITTSLLEKTRVVKQKKGERNFHIFYQILAGVEPQVKDLLGLDCADDFDYLRGTGVNTNIDDLSQYRITQQSMTDVGISEMEQTEIIRILAGILHLGNIKFEVQQGRNQQEDDEDDNNSDHFTKITDDSLPLLKRVAQCLQLSSIQQLQDALHYRTIQVGQQRNNNQQKMRVYFKTVEACNNNRDALAKSIYEGLFLWLIRRINEALVDEQMIQDFTSIGVLDISGFEVQEQENERRSNNGLEQFNINFVNEKIQQTVQRNLTDAQQEYIKEGVILGTSTPRRTGSTPASSTPKQVVDDDENFVVLDAVDRCLAAIEGKPIGVYSLLNEQSLMPKGTDQQFVEKMSQTMANQKKFKAFKTHRFGGTLFNLEHYTAPVTYDSKGWLDMNRDTLIQDQVQLMTSSHSDLVRQLFDVEGTKAHNKLQGTIAQQLQSDVQTVLSKLENKKHYYIMCVKPNNSKQAQNLETALLLQQVRYLGLLHQIQMTQIGFYTSFPYEHFLDRFHQSCSLFPLLPKFSKHEDTDAIKLACEVLLRHNGVKNYGCGYTKIFLKSAHDICLLNDRLEKRRDKVATVIQRAYRDHRFRERMKVEMEEAERRRILLEQQMEEMRRLELAAKPVEEFEVEAGTDHTVKQTYEPLKFENAAMNGAVTYKKKIENLTPIQMMKYAKFNKAKKVQVIKPDSPDVFEGKKLRRRASFEQTRADTDNGRHDYLRMQFSDLMDQLNEEYGDQKVYFSALVRQYRTNHDDFQQGTIMIMITERAMYLVDSHGYLLQKIIKFHDFRHVTVSTLTDGFIIMHMKDTERTNYDFVFETALKTVLVRILSERSDRKLRFRVGDEVIVNIKGGEEKTLTFIETKRRLPIKTHLDSETPMSYGTPVLPTDDEYDSKPVIKTQTQVIRTEPGADILVRINRSDLLLSARTPTPMRAMVMDVYRGEKLRRRTSLLKWYAGDYLNLMTNESFLKKLPEDDRNILFSAIINKVDVNLIVRDRKLIVTDKAIYLCGKEGFKVKRRIDLASVVSIGVSTYRDGFFVLNLDKDGDYLLNSAYDKTEIVKIIMEAQKKLLNHQVLEGKDLVRNSDVGVDGVQPDSVDASLIGLELVVENKLYYHPKRKVTEEDENQEKSNTVTATDDLSSTATDYRRKRAQNDLRADTRTVEFQEDNTQDVLVTLHRTLTGILVKVNNDMDDSADLMAMRPHTDIYNGRKMRRRVSLSREMIGDYSGIGTSASRNKTKLMSKNKDSLIMYCGATSEGMHKLGVNRLTNTVQRGHELTALVTDKHFYQIDPNSFKVEKMIALEDISSISVSSLPDNVVCLHMVEENEKDLLFECEKKTEFIEQLYIAVSERNKIQGKRPLQINVSDEFAYKTHVVDRKTLSKRLVKFVMDHVSRETFFEYDGQAITAHVHYEQPHVVLEEAFIYVRDQERPIPISAEPVTIKMGKNWSYKVEIRFYVNNRPMVGYKFYEKIDTASSRKEYVSDVNTLMPREERYAITMPERKVVRSLLSKTRVKCKLVDPLGRTVFDLRFVYDVKYRSD